MKTRISLAAAILVGAALVVPARLALAGDIIGTVKVRNPAQMVVYLEKVPGDYEAQKVLMDQEEKVFLPFVLPVIEGSTVEFRNSDGLKHNVFGVGADEFDLGDWNRGVSRNHTFNKAGEVAILCNVHPEMEAYILVMQNSYFARPDEAGNFKIANVPEGQYVLKAWYRGKTKKQKVSVPASGKVTADF